MAKKRKKKGGSKRRRRVGGLNLKGGTGLKLLAVAGGFLAGKQVNTAIDGLVNTIKKDAASTVVTNADGTATVKRSMLVTAGQVGLGGMLLLKAKGTLPIVAGGLLAGAALKAALSGMGVIGGYQNVPVIGSRRLAGYQNVPVIGNTPSQLAGSRLPAQMQGFKVNGGLGTNGYGSQGSGVMGTVMNPNAAAMQQGSGINTGSGYMN